MIQFNPRWFAPTLVLVVGLFYFDHVGWFLALVLWTLYGLLS